MTTSLGQRLLALRKERGLILSDVAGAAGISVSYLNDLEHDRTQPSMDVLVRVATAFDVSAIDLLRGVPPYDASTSR